MFASLRIVPASRRGFHFLIAGLDPGDQSGRSRSRRTSRSRGTGRVRSRSRARLFLSTSTSAPTRTDRGRVTSRSRPKAPGICRWPRSWSRISTFHLSCPACRATPLSQGKLEAGHKTIKGTFTQGGKSFPFQLEAGIDPVAAAKGALIGFDSFVNEAIKAWEVPGLALAIVKNGQIILVQGFGFRDVEGKLPVTPKTLFAIGSCTKAFTTFVMGTLVDEGKLDWDAPVRNYIPEFRMYDRVATELMTPRDLVTHRSGLPRHDLVWYNATISRKQIVDRLPYLEPSETFRSKFQYNNLMFMTAGYLVERVTGKSWEDTVRLRIFEPLGMTGSNFSVKDSQKTADFAKPYADRDDKVVEVPFRDISNAGPAGSINSNVEDMSRWLIVHTQKGKIDGKQVISAAVLADIHSPHMTTGALQQRPEIAPAGYGLGWSVDDYRGHRRVHHGGGIDGFTTMTTLFPEDGLGLIAVANMSGTSLPEMVTRHAADRLLGLSTIDWSGEELGKKAKNKAASKEAKSKKDTVRRPGTTPAHPLEEYAGDYENPGYGVVKIELRNGKLDIRVQRHRSAAGALALRGLQRTQESRKIPHSKIRRCNSRRT